MFLLVHSTEKSISATCHRGRKGNKTLLKVLDYQLTKQLLIGLSVIFISSKRSFQQTNSQEVYISLLTCLFLSQPWVIYASPISILQVQSSLLYRWHCDKVTGWELQSSQIVTDYSMCKQSQGLGICTLCSQTRNMQNTFLPCQLPYCVMELWPAQC